MNLIEVPEAGFSVEIPGSYSEMTQTQVFFVMQQLYALQRGKISLTEFRVRILYHLVGIKRTVSSIVWNRIHPTVTNHYAEKIVLLAEQLLEFLFTSQNGMLLPSFDAIKNHLPYIRIGRTHLVGPCDGLIDLSFGELIAADADLLLYTTTKDEQHIDNMIARLYRCPGPMQPCGRKVEPFSMDQTENYARLIHCIPGWKKQLFLLWYSACIHNLQHGYFYVSGREVTFDPLFSKAEGNDTSLGWLGVQFDLAEKHIFGDMTATAEANIIDILSLLLNYKNTADHVRKLKETD